MKSLIQIENLESPPNQIRIKYNSVFLSECVWCLTSNQFNISSLCWEDWQAREIFLCCRSMSRAASNTASSYSPLLPNSDSNSARASPGPELESPRFRVCMMGESQVGKTSLVSQFLTSDFLNTYDASLGKTPLSVTPEIINLIWKSPWASEGNMSLVNEIFSILWLVTIFYWDDEYGEKSVSVSLDGQEAELRFIDHPSNEMSVGFILTSTLIG